MKTKAQFKIGEFFRNSPIDEYISPSNSEFFRELTHKLARISATVEILYANKDYNRFASSQKIRSKQDDGIHSENYFENFEMFDTVQFELEYVKKRLENRKNEIEFTSDITLEEKLSGRTTEVYDKEKKYIVFKIPDKSQFIKDKLKNIMDGNNAMKFYGVGLEQIQEIREKQLSLFEELINQKPGLTDKDIFIDRDTGDIKVKMFGRDDVLLPIEKLSSGEKNWLLLHFYLIFFTNNNSILLIDEPEVSMHPEWLINFVDNCKMIFEDKEVQIIIATHSPSITYYDSDVMVEMRRI